LNFVNTEDNQTVADAINFTVVNKNGSLINVYAFVSDNSTKNEVDVDQTKKMINKHIVSIKCTNHVLALVMKTLSEDEYYTILNIFLEKILQLV